MVMAYPGLWFALGLGCDGTGLAWICLHAGRIPQLSRSELFVDASLSQW